MDIAARKIGQSADAVRRVNFIGRDEMPFHRGMDALGTDVVYDSGDYAGLLDRFHQHFSTADIDEACARRRAAGECVGFGHAMFVEKSGLGPFDAVRVSVTAGGTVEVVTGVASIGQGVETVIAQIVGETLGVPLSSITVVHGQTDRIADGRGAFASRVTAMTGPAAGLAAGELKADVLALAAVELQQQAAGLDIVDGHVVVRGTASGPSVAIADLVRAGGGVLSREHWFRTSHMNYPYGVHGAVVRVDPETGSVAVERILIAYDIGRAVNPMLVDGQLAGGAAQGIGGALLEEFRFDDSGQPLSTSFADYLMPTMAEIPPIDTLIAEDAPSPVNPLGVKGAGEGGITAIGAAIASAIDAALEMPGAVQRLPVSMEWLAKTARQRRNAGRHVG